MKRSFSPAHYSVLRRRLSAAANAVSRDQLPRRLCRCAFTLIELLVVVAIVATLAALTLGTLGYVNKKGAESRARSEVAALSAAVDAYKLDFGSFPASNNLYTELTGQGPTNTNKIYFEPTPGVADTNTQRFVDPWDGPYQYDPVNPTNNVGLFDLWTTNNSADPALWIRN